MKRLLILLYCIVLTTAVSTVVSAGEIDDLKTASDVNQFLKKVNPKYADEMSIDTKETPKTEFGANTFHKVDLDGDGKTDLIVESNYLFVVTDKHDLVMVDRGGFTFYRYTLLKIEKNGNDTVLRIRPKKVEDFPAPASDKELSLVFKFGGFVEFNPKPDHMKIESIVFSTSGCFGSCPIFTLNLRADRRATYQAKQYNPVDGKFSGTIDAADYNRLEELINYMGLGSLKTEYSVPWTDDQGSTLSISYDGTTKKISDYGMIGTYGLENLYDNLSKLRTSQKWAKVK